MQEAKQARHDLILELVERYAIDNQEALRNLLLRRGLEVTQATLSRDLRQLNVIKGLDEENGGYRYRLRESYGGLLVESCQLSGNLLVLHTPPGLAAAAAYRIDGLGLPEILGTIAGEDTVLAVIAEGHDGRRVKERVWARIQT